MSIFRSLRLCCWTTTLAVSFLICCVLELGCGSARVVSRLPAKAQQLLFLTNKKYVFQHVAVRVVRFGKGECVEWRETGVARMVLVDRTKRERSRRWCGVTECPLSPLRIAVVVENNTKFLFPELLTALTFRKSDNKYRTRGKCR